VRVGELKFSVRVDVCAAVGFLRGQCLLSPRRQAAVRIVPFRKILESPGSNSRRTMDCSSNASLFLGRPLLF
jgi:hypothetical protein